MYQLRHVISLLKNTTSLQCFNGFVPEGESKPALAVNEISNSSNRVIEGSKYGRTNVWRVSIVTNSSSELQPILEQIEALDNTKNQNFKRIHVQYVLTEPKTPGQEVYRAFYDITLY